MKFETTTFRFEDLTLNFDKQRIPLSSGQRENRQGQYRYYGAQGVIDYVDDYIFDGKYLLIAEDGENLKSKKQDIAQIVEGKFWVNNHAHVVQGNALCLTEYLCYLLNHNDLSGYITGSAQPKLSQANLNAIAFDVPSIETQQKIVSIISALDEKIAINRAINDNLLQQLHMLYSQLFCDSDMDTLLGDVVVTKSGGTPSRKHNEYYSNSLICWVKSKELLGNYIYETEEHINDLAINKSSAKLLPEHSILIAMYGATVGAYGIISKSMTCNQAVCALLCNEDYPYTYLFQLAHESQQRLINLAVGSAQQNISQVLIKQLTIHSNLNAIQKFHALALPLHREIESLQAENIRLLSLRDTLLPKLMSGEIDVSAVKL